MNLHLDAALLLEAEIGQPGFREAHGPVSALDFAMADAATRAGCRDPHQRATARRRRAALDRIAGLVLDTMNDDVNARRTR